MFSCAILFSMYRKLNLLNSVHTLSLECLCMLNWARERVASATTMAIWPAPINHTFIVCQTMRFQWCDLVHFLGSSSIMKKNHRLENVEIIKYIKNAKFREDEKKFGRGIQQKNLTKPKLCLINITLILYYKKMVIYSTKNFICWNYISIVHCKLGYCHYCRYIHCKGCIEGRYYPKNWPLILSESLELWEAEPMSRIERCDSCTPGLKFSALYFFLSIQNIFLKIAQSPWPWF